MLINDRAMHTGLFQRLLELLRMDYALLLGLLLLIAVGVLVLYSAADQSMNMVIRQFIRLGLALAVMLVLAQISPHALRLWSPWLYLLGVFALLMVFFFGTEGKGAQRWLDLGFVKFQPSELMKLAVPMMLAWYLSRRPLPPLFSDVVVVGIIIGIPMFLIIKQPDLGTALLVGVAGFFILFLAGLSWRILFIGSFCAVILARVAWTWPLLHAYQKQRILTFLNPESDPLGSGYHIIQSKIAIGSGGAYGKGWLNGTQSQLDFLPESATDFIFSVYGEELGLFGAVLLLLLYVFIVLRGLRIATKARDSYSRLLAASISLTFFVYVVVNIGMVTGLLPVVGVPLPLMSYGGTSMVTLMAGFGILMSIHSDRRFITR